MNYLNYEYFPLIVIFSMEAEVAVQLALKEKLPGSFSEQVQVLAAVLESC